MCPERFGLYGLSALGCALTTAIVMVGCGKDPYEAALNSGSEPVVDTTPTPATEPAAASTATPTSASEPLPPATAPTPPSPTTDAAGASGARVFVDVSGSMQGFVRYGRDLAMESLHLSIGHALSKAGVGPVDYCDVGAASRTRCGLPADPRRYRKPAVYNGLTSQMSAILARIPKTAALGKDLTIPVGALDERHVSVVITDGIEVSGKTTLTPGEEAAGCLPGLDTYCLQRVLVKRAEEGYGVWLHALSLPFDGRVYPERGLDKAMYASISDYLTSLRSDDGPFSSLDGKGMRITPPGYNRGKADGYYRFEGVRPLLVLVLSKDIEAGRQVSTFLERELRTLPIEKPAGRYRSLQLAPHEPATVVFDTDSVQLVPKTDPAGNARAAVRTPPHRVRGQGVKTELECEADGAGTVVFGLKTIPPASTDWPPGFSMHHSVSVELGAGSEVMTHEPGVNEQPHAITFKCQRVSAGSKLKPAAEVRAEFVFEAPAEDTPAAWWHDWTAPDTFSRPERMYRLADLVESVLATNRADEAIHDRLVIEVYRKPAAAAP